MWRCVLGRKSVCLPNPMSVSKPTLACSNKHMYILRNSLKQISSLLRSSDFCYFIISRQLRTVEWWHKMLDFYHSISFYHKSVCLWWSHIDFWTICNKVQWNFNQNTAMFIQEYERRRQNGGHFVSASLSLLWSCFPLSPANETKILYELRTKTQT